MFLQSCDSGLAYDWYNMVTVAILDLDLVF